MNTAAIRFVVLVLFSQLCSLAAASPSLPLDTIKSNPLESNLLHHWAFDEGTGNQVSDQQGQLNGVIEGHKPQWAKGRKNGALHLSDNSCIALQGNQPTSTQVPHIRLGRSDGNYKGWTLALWINKQAQQATSTLLSSPEYHLDLESGSQSTLSLGRNNVTDLKFNYGVEVGQWVHLTLVATATSTTLYTNGLRQQILWDNQLDVDNSAKSAITYEDFHKVYEGYNSLPLSMIGCASNGQGINAVIDELKVYGAAFTPEQVAQHYNHYVDQSEAVNYRQISSAQRVANLLPKPLQSEQLDGEFTIVEGTPLYTAHGNTEEINTALRFISSTEKATGFKLALITQPTKNNSDGITFTIDPSRTHLDKEGYELEVSPTQGVTLTAANQAGLFYASQTLLQLLPSAIGSKTHVPDVSWTVSSVRISDKPRYQYRGYLLDVVRHFYSVDEVKNIIDQLSHYKINYLHLHLTDDQGWRIEIKSHPELTEVGGKYAHHGACKDCFYTQEQYQDIVAYAAQKQMTVIPEIDVPGHTTVFMKAKNLCGLSDVEVYGWVNHTLCFYNYPKLLSYLPDSIRQYIEVSLTESGFLNSEEAYQHILSILNDVFSEVAAITPGDYIHLGADESSSSLYPRFIFDVQNIINQHGKKAIGWNEMATKIGVENMKDDTIIQYWVKGELGDHKNKVLLSPFDKIYLDQKYQKDIDYGYNKVDIKTAYDWEPANYLEGVDEDRVIGVEGTMWTESAAETGVVEFMSFPRQLGVAELGWSTPENRDWDDYRQRLRFHGERMEFLGINFYRSPLIWPDSTETKTGN